MRTKGKQVRSWLLASACAPYRFANEARRLPRPCEGDGSIAEVITQLAWLLERSPHVTLILIMRDDFYSLFVQHEALALWTQSGHTIPQMASVQPW